MVNLHRDACGICDMPIKHLRDMVLASSYPWLLLDIAPDTVHRTCANALVAEIEATRRGDEASYEAGIADVFKPWRD